MGPMRKKHNSSSDSVQSLIRRAWFQCKAMCTARCIFHRASKPLAHSLDDAKL